MKLLRVTMQTPVRDEKQIIYKWEDRFVWLNPRNIESCGFVEEIDKLQLLTTSGRCLPIKEGLQEFEKLFQAATS